MHNNLCVLLQWHILNYLLTPIAHYNNQHASETNAIKAITFCHLQNLDQMDGHLLGCKCKKIKNTVCSYDSVTEVLLNIEWPSGIFWC